jgi:hypothetical protein
MNAKNIFANCTDALHLKAYLHSFFTYNGLIHLILLIDLFKERKQRIT